MLALLADPTAWFALLTLTAMEIVLGIDNIVFLSVLVSHLPETMARRARQIGLAMALIFRPGFSTQDEVTMDAGRGVGMDVVARTVYGLGGKIGVSTNPGRFTRFKIVLPATEAASSAVA